MIVAIHQPNFLPWIGYFNKIKQVDTFVFLDDVQFERGKTFTSRTKILVQGKELWLTIPVIKRSALKNIKDIKVDSNFTWKTKHIKTLFHSYHKAPFFNEIFVMIEEVYGQKSTYLVDYNIPLIEKICDYLQLVVEFKRSCEILIQNNSATGLEKILEILRATEASIYISGSGSGSKRYIDEDLLNKNGINIHWQDFKHKLYPQLNVNNFISHLSIIDLLFNCGRDSVKYL